jgi:putative endonuclease
MGELICRPHFYVIPERTSGIQSSLGRPSGMKQYYVYILSSGPNGTLYIGVTSDLAGCVYEHKNNLADGFTKKYQVHNLVYYECADNPEAAISREKQLKKWNRLWKLDLINRSNPSWKDLYNEIAQ